MSTSSDSVGTNHSAAQPVSHAQALPTNAQGSSPYGPILNLMSTSDWRDDRLAFALDSDFNAAPSLTLPSPETPLYSALLEKLSDTDDEHLMESFADCFVFDKLKFKKPYGSAEQPADKTNDPYELGLRIENLLAVTQEQRSKHLARLTSRDDA